MKKNTLQWRPLQENITETIGFSSNLLFDESLLKEPTNLVVDKNLSVLTEKNKGLLLFEKKIKQKSARIGSLSGTFFLYKHPHPNDYSFEAEDSFRMFGTAVRIFYNKDCDFRGFLHSKNDEYYEPYVENERHTPYPQNKTIISSFEDLGKIQKIYTNLKISRVERQDTYSKLHNAVTFFNRSYDTDWILLKILFSFSLLESLFSDSDKNEVVYKIALRTSYFLYPENLQERMRVFKFIKHGYDIRSYFVHGSDVQNRINRIRKKIAEERSLGAYSFLRDFPQELDLITSQCLSKILLNDELFSFFSKEKISSSEESAFYDKLVLSAECPHNY